MSTAMPRVKAIFRYPVKGIGGEERPQVTVTKHGIAGDRAFAFAFTDTLPPEKNKNGVELLEWVPKSKLAVQNDWPALALLHAHVTDDGTLTLRKGSLTQSWNTRDVQGRALASQFVSQFIKTISPSPVAKHPEPTDVILAGTPIPGLTRYPDREREHLSILNAATLEDIEVKLKLKIDVQRFRGNLIVEDLKAWQEYAWKDHEIRVGSVKAKVTAFTVRCHNINVNQNLGLADLDLLPKLKELTFKSIQQNFAIFGVLAQVLEPGQITTGDSIELLNPVAVE